jgi:hypothetical protein
MSVGLLDAWFRICRIEKENARIYSIKEIPGVP